MTDLAWMSLFSHRLSFNHFYENEKKTTLTFQYKTAFMHTEQIFLGVGVESEFYSHDSPNDWAVCEGPAELSAYFVGAVVLLSSGGLDGDLGNRRAVLFPWTVLGTNVHSPCLFIKCF